MKKIDNIAEWILAICLLLLFLSVIVFWFYFGILLTFIDYVNIWGRCVGVFVLIVGIAGLIKLIYYFYNFDKNANS